MFLCTKEIGAPAGFSSAKVYSVVMSSNLSPVTDLAPNVSCARCGAPFVCGYTAGAAQCWCMHVEGDPLPVPEASSDAACLCQTCLQLAKAQHADEFLKT